MRERDNSNGGREVRDRWWLEVGGCVWDGAEKPRAKWGIIGVVSANVSECGACGSEVTVIFVWGSAGGACVISSKVGGLKHASSAKGMS